MGPRVELDIVIGATKSMGSHEATLFTDDVAKLGTQLGAEVSKTSVWKSIKLHRSRRELACGSNWHFPSDPNDMLKYINVFL
jgi:hypothetical protein